MAILNESRMFGDIFKELRTEKKLSQDKLAKELEISQGLITKWESHQSTPSPEMLDYIADYFKVSTDYLIGRTNDRRYFSDEQLDKNLNILYSKIKQVPEEYQHFLQKLLTTIVNDFLDDNSQNE